MSVTEIKVERTVDVDVCCSCCLLFQNLPAICCLGASDAHHYTTNAGPGRTVRISMLPVLFLLLFLLFLSHFHLGKSW